MKIFKATRKYEEWLREQLGVFEDDLSFKAKKLAEDPSSFLRGTFYRWMQLLPEVCRKAAQAPDVLAVGDLHAANFGTWQNARGELVWGINDFDEAAPLPYTFDLIRLAVSVVVASESQELATGLEEACASILEGYQTSLEAGGRAILLNEEQAWLRDVYLQGGKSVAAFWEKLERLPDIEFEIPEAARIALEASLPKGVEYRLKHRLAGVGSLGRPRYTALATVNGERIAREAKPLLPSAALWAQKRLKGAEIYYEEVLARAVRSLDPVVKVYEGWVVRRLAPDSRRIELTELGPERDEKRILTAMGWETGNIHLGTPLAVKAVLADLQERKPNWLAKAARKMENAVLEDWETWKEKK